MLDMNGAEWLAYRGMKPASCSLETFVRVSLPARHHTSYLATFRWCDASVHLFIPLKQLQADRTANDEV